jgi:hypothetical protein
MAQAESVSSAIRALITGASATLSTNPVRLAHIEFVASLAAYAPTSMPVDADVLDLDYRADHLEAVFCALSIYLTAILNDTAQNAPGGLDLGHIEAVLSDLTSDVTGAIHRAADGIAGRVA